jgi:hypothetical protein
MAACRLCRRILKRARRDVDATRMSSPMLLDVRCSAGRGAGLVKAAVKVLLAALVLGGRAPC